jgi:hypothetical protein
MLKGDSLRFFQRLSAADETAKVVNAAPRLAEVARAPDAIRQCGVAVIREGLPEQ